MLILVSASPRRHEILRAAGIEHVVQPSAIVEHRLAGEDVIDFVARLAKNKAEAVEGGAGDIVLSADTAVCIEDRVFGKPRNDDEASEMLRLLSGRMHWVHTGIFLAKEKQRISDVASTKVWFLPLEEDQIRQYVRSGECWDKAGAYAIQGRASKFVTSIEGSYQNVVGLPIAMVYRHLRALDATVYL